MPLNYLATLYNVDKLSAGHDGIGGAVSCATRIWPTEPAISAEGSCAWPAKLFVATRTRPTAVIAGYGLRRGGRLPNIAGNLRRGRALLLDGRGDRGCDATHSLDRADDGVDGLYSLCGCSLHSADLAGDLLGRCCRLCGQALHLAGDHGKALASLSGSRCLDRRVQGQSVRRASSTALPLIWADSATCWLISWMDALSCSDATATVCTPALACAAAPVA